MKFITLDICHRMILVTTIAYCVVVLINKWGKKTHQNYELLIKIKVALRMVRYLMPAKIKNVRLEVLFPLKIHHRYHVNECKVLTKKGLIVYMHVLVQYEKLHSMAYVT